MPGTSADAPKKSRGRPKGSKNKKTVEKEKKSATAVPKASTTPPLHPPGDVPPVPRPKRSATRKAGGPKDPNGPLSGHLSHKAPVSDFTNYIFSNKFA